MHNLICHTAEIVPHSESRLRCPVSCFLRNIDSLCGCMMCELKKRSCNLPWIVPVTPISQGLKEAFRCSTQRRGLTQSRRGPTSIGSTR
jgi:hypothetical protein